MFKIESSVPMASNGAGAPRKYPFYDMKIGQSFFVEGQDSQGKAATAAHAYSRKSGTKFSARKADGGVRIWRTA